VEQTKKDLVKPSQATETRCGRNTCHRHVCVVNELLRKQYTPRLCNGDWRCAKMLEKNAPQLTLADSQPFCQLLDGILRSAESAFVNES